MTRLRLIATLLITVAIIAAALRPHSPSRTPLQAQGYRIVTADFHVHSFPGDTAFLAPWDELLEAQRVHLDVIALSSHNHIWSGVLGQWLSGFLGGPLVIPGEEIFGLGRHYHMLAIGIHSPIDWRNSASEAIDQIHAQGGVAIAAHPRALYWPAYDSAARAKLDGAEVLHPGIFLTAAVTQEFREFFASGSYAAIADSDYRGNGLAGICRTYLFVKDVSEQDVLDAVRTHHTVVYDRGQFFGDPKLAAILIAHRSELSFDQLDGDVRPFESPSRIGGVIGLLLLIVLDTGRSLPASRHQTERPRLS
jgi:hypothetical protein